MKALRVYGCLTLLPVLGILGCSAEYVKKGAERVADTVTIANCAADPDTVGVPRGHALTWHANDRAHYAIHFPRNKPIATADPAPEQGQTVTGDFACNYGGWISDSFCVYPYTLTKDGTTCKDPGVHVIPTSE